MALSLAIARGVNIILNLSSVRVKKKKIVFKPSGVNVWPCQPASFLNPLAFPFLLFDLSPLYFLCSADLSKHAVLYHVLNFKHSESAYVLNLFQMRSCLGPGVCLRSQDCGLILAGDLAGFSF